MFRRRFFGCVISIIILLTVIPGETAVASRPGPAYTSPWKIERVDYPADTYTGTHISLKYKQDINRAYISYYDVTDHTLKLAFNPWPQSQGGCNSITGPFACITLDGDGANGHSTDDVGMHNSVDVSTAAFIGVGVSYYDKTLQALKYVQYECSFACTTSIYIVDLVNGMDIGSYGTSIKFTSGGVPYIAYSYSNPSDHNLDELRLAHWVGTGGNCGIGADHGKFQCDVIQRGYQTGRSPSLGLVDAPGSPILQIAYLSGVNTLYYAASTVGNRCTAGAASGWKCYMIDDSASADISLYTFNTIPNIAYFDRNTGDLRFATYVGEGPTANCGALYAAAYGWRCDTIERIVLDGTHPERASVSLAMDGSGYPAIAYEYIPSAGPVGLKIARPLEAYHYDIGNCGPVPEGGFLGDWLCSTVDGGSGNTDEAAFAGIGLRSNGLAIIAFTEDDNYNYTQRLMVAWQHTYSYLPLIRK